MKIFIANKKTKKQKMETETPRRNRLDLNFKHAFRRFNGTFKVQNGVPETVVADLLGNSVKTLHKHYLIHSPDYLRGTISPLQ